MDEEDYGRQPRVLKVRASSLCFVFSSFLLTSIHPFSAVMLFLTFCGLVIFVSRSRTSNLVYHTTPSFGALLSERQHEKQQKEGVSPPFSCFVPRYSPHGWYNYFKSAHSLWASTDKKYADEFVVLSTPLSFIYALLTLVYSLHILLFYFLFNCCVYGLRYGVRHSLLLCARIHTYTASLYVLYLRVCDLTPHGQRKKKRALCCFFVFKKSRFFGCGRLPIPERLTIT